MYCILNTVHEKSSKCLDGSSVWGWVFEINLKQSDTSLNVPKSLRWQRRPRAVHHCPSANLCDSPYHSLEGSPNGPCSVLQWKLEFFQKHHHRLPWGRLGLWQWIVLRARACSLPHAPYLPIRHLRRKTRPETTCLSEGLPSLPIKVDQLVLWSYNPFRILEQYRWS